MTTMTTRRRRSVLPLYFYAVVFGFLVAIVLECINLPLGTSNGSHQAMVFSDPKTTFRLNDSPVVRNATTTMGQTIRFFLYPFELFPYSYGQCGKTIASPKHSHDVFAFEAMENHPWRRYYDTIIARENNNNNSENQRQQVDIAILPVLLDQLSRGHCNESVTTQVVLEEVHTALQQYDLFPRVRHVILANDFKSARHASTKKLVKALRPAGIWIAMEGRGDCQTSAGYLSNAALYNATLSNKIDTKPEDPTYYQRDFNIETLTKPNPTRPASERIYSIHMVGGFDSRWAYRDRLHLFQSQGTLPSNPYIIAKENKDHIRSLWWWQRPRFCNMETTTTNSNSNNACQVGGGDYDRCIIPSSFQCPDRGATQRAAELSNYTLLLRGDTLGGDRLINAMAAGTALIFVVENDKDLEWMPFPHAIPWKDLILRIYRSDFAKDPAGSLTRLVNSITPQRLQELQNLSRHYVADLDWTTTSTSSSSRMLENMLYEVATIPCQAHDDYTVQQRQGNGKPKK